MWLPNVKPIPRRQLRRTTKPTPPTTQSPTIQPISLMMLLPLNGHTRMLWSSFKFNENRSRKSKERWWWSGELVWVCAIAKHTYMHVTTGKGNRSGKRHKIVCLGGWERQLDCMWACVYVHVCEMGTGN